jgi:hypothetical protein
MGRRTGYSKVIVRRDPSGYGSRTAEDSGHLSLMKGMTRATTVRDASVDSPSGFAIPSGHAACGSTIDLLHRTGHGDPDA